MFAILIIILLFSVEKDASVWLAVASYEIDELSFDLDIEHFLSVRIISIIIGCIWDAKV